MLLNESPIRMVSASRIQKILQKQKNCWGGRCQQNIPALYSMAVHHSALLHIVIAQAYLKLENTVDFYGPQTNRR